MAKIYEALQQAQRQRDGIEKLPLVTLPEEPSPSRSQFSKEKEMLSLYQNIDSLLPDIGSKVVQFMGCREGEGASTIVREFAKISVRVLQKKVLLLDSNRRNPSQHLVFNIRPSHGWEDVLRDEGAFDRSIYRIGDSNLYLAPVSPRTTLSAQHFDCSSMKDYFEVVRKRFDLILVDSPAATASPDGIAFSRTVDGVVLVLEAEETRWPTAARARDQIVRNGGRILGLVFNKRRYHIPNFIYERLK